MTKTHRTKRKRWIWLPILGLLAVLLQQIPGRYTFRDLSDDFDPGTPEAVLLAGVASAEVSAELYFARATVQRISRNAELGVPAGATLRLRARTTPQVDPESGEVFVAPEDVEILSDLPLTFIYRNVPLARSRELRSVPGDPEKRVRAYGRYRMLSALPHLHRYERRRGGPRRVWAAPDRAEVTFSATLHTGHTFSFEEGMHFTSASNTGGSVQLTDLLFEDGRWLAGRLALEMGLADPLSFPGGQFREVVDGKLTLSGRVLPPEGTERGRVAIVGELAMAEALLLGGKEMEDFSVRLQDWETLFEGTGILDAEGKLDGEDFQVRWQHTLRDLSYRSPRDTLRLPYLDLREPALTFRLRDDFRGGTLRMTEALDVRGIQWARQRRRESLRIEEGRLRMNPFEFDLSFDEKGIRGEGEGLSGLLEAWSVGLRRDEDQQVTLLDPVRLNLQADRVVLEKGEIMIEGATVTGSAGKLEGRRKELQAVVNGAEVALQADRQSEQDFQFSGRVLAREGATVQLPEREGLPDLDFFLRAGPVGISGDQDAFRVRIPSLRVSIPRKTIHEILDQMVSEQRERIREETEDELSVGVDVRRVQELAFFENRAVVVMEGRVYMLRDMVHTSFSAEFTLDFEPPEDVALSEARLGFAATLTGIKLNRVNPRIERLILRRVRRPLFREARDLSSLVSDLPEGIMIDRVRLQAEDEQLVLTLSLQEGTEIEF